MVKRISCRVVSSVALGKSSDVLRRGGRSDNKHHRVGDIVVMSVPARCAGNWVTYMGQFGVARVFIDDGPIGQILDCYV